MSRAGHALRKRTVALDRPEGHVGRAGVGHVLAVDFIRGEVPQSRVLDSDLDADALWPLFQRVISDSLGVDPEEVTQGKGLNDLGATWFL